MHLKVLSEHDTALGCFTYLFISSAHCLKHIFVAPSLKFDLFGCEIMGLEGQMTYTHSSMIYQNIIHQIYGILPGGEIYEHVQLTISG